jgi:hypothetical protein
MQHAAGPLPMLTWEGTLRSIAIGLFVSALFIAGVTAGWLALNYYQPGTVGTPAHAGAISNGRPEECTNVNFSVRPRETEDRPVLLEEDWIVRGTFEAQGGFGRVDIFMRIVSPQGLELHASPKAENYDFVLPVKLRGQYTFVFDNRYSLYTSKSVAFYYCIDRGTPR